MRVDSISSGILTKQIKNAWAGFKRVDRSVVALLVNIKCKEPDISADIEHACVIRQRHSILEVRLLNKNLPVEEVRRMLVLLRDPHPVRQLIEWAFPIDERLFRLLFH